MGGCASRPKELDGKAPEDLPAEIVAPSDATAVAATTIDAATESNENIEKENKEEAELSENVEQENKEEAPATEVAVVEASEQKAETTKDTHDDGVKEETKPDEKPSQS